MSASFRVGDDEFPIPSSFTLSDGALGYEASGLEFGEFADRVGELEDNPGDVRTLTAMVAIAVSRSRPQWSRRRVVQYLAGVDLESFSIDGGEADGPPAEPPTQAASPISSDESTTSQEGLQGAPV